MQTKRCNFCNTVFPVGMFYRHKNNKDGLRSDCKDCNKIVVRLWAIINPEKRRANSNNWRTKNLVKARKAVIKWQKVNPERMRDHYRKRRILKRSQLGWLPDQYEQKLWEIQFGRCLYCDTSLVAGFHVDHMTPLSRDGKHDWWNVCLTCPTCNLRKNDKTDEEFFDLLEQAA